MDGHFPHQYKTGNSDAVAKVRGGQADFSVAAGRVATPALSRRRIGYDVGWFHAEKAGRVFA